MTQYVVREPVYNAAQYSGANGADVWALFSPAPAGGGYATDPSGNLVLFGVGPSTYTVPAGSWVVVSADSGTVFSVVVDTEFKARFSAVA